MEETIKDRFIEYLKHLGIGQGKFEKNTGIGNGTINNIKDGISSPKLAKISLTYPDLNIEWLITGNGEMLKECSNNALAPKRNSKSDIPFYADIPMSAGEQGKNIEAIQEIPTGFMNIPNITAKYLFPVIGYSMIPTIKPGDIIGVNDVHRWDRVEPDKIYLIITNEERMIKRLRIDNDNENILWCVSDNYKEFKIYKNDIVNIYHVVYHGEFL